MSLEVSKRVASSFRRLATSSAMASRLDPRLVRTVKTLPSRSACWLGSQPELAGVSGELLSGTRHYAGAALLRQVVEIEYLTWAFANEVRDAADWLNSTHEDRMCLFTPAKLRTTSGGRFNAKDYRDHCEQGGHPVPGAVGLIDGSGGLAAQMLLVDLLLHCWRTADNVAHWFQNSSNAPAAFPYAIRAAKRALAAWGEKDPLYPWLCSVSPAPDPEL